MHTTGTTSLEGIHQLAPGLGERRPMDPPSGGQFKMPAGYGSQAQEPQAALPGHKVELAGSTTMPPNWPVPGPNSQQSQIPVVGPTHEGLGAELRAQLTHVPSSPHVRSLPPMPPPPAPAGYQSAPAFVPPGMVAQTVVHEHIPQAMYPGHAPHGLGQPVGWPHATPAVPIAPHQQPVWQPEPQTTAHPLTAQPQPVHAALGHGITVQLEGEPQALEAALGMLMMRGIRVKVV